MDPNQTLADIRSLVSAINAETDADDMAEKAEELATLFQSLDEWILGGGFMPEAWDRTSRDTEPG